MLIRNPSKNDKALIKPIICFGSGFGGNGATIFFLIFAISAGVVGVVSKLAGGSHIRAWRNDSLAAAGASSLVAWALTVLAFGYVYIMYSGNSNHHKYNNSNKE